MGLVAGERLTAMSCRKRLYSKSRPAFQLPISSVIYTAMQVVIVNVRPANILLCFVFNLLFSLGHFENNATSEPGFYKILSNNKHCLLIGYQE